MKEKRDREIVIIEAVHYLVEQLDCDAAIRVLTYLQDRVRSGQEIKTGPTITTGNTSYIFTNK